MIRFVARRFAGSLFVFYLVATLVFGMVQLAPGNVATTMGGAFASPQYVAQLRREFGLNEPFLDQYGHYMRKLLTFNLGTSNVTNLSVRSELLSRAGPTLELAALAALMAIVLGIIGGLLAAANPGGLADAAVRIGSVIGISIPQFWLGLMLIIVFGIDIPGVFPTSGWVPWGQSPAQNLLHLVLPAVTLGVGALGVVARTLRASMLDSLRRDYVSFARGAGLRKWKVLLSVAFPNAAVPTTTVIGLLIGFLVGGTVIVEQVFSIPGVGQMLVQSFENRDIPAGIGATLFVAATFLIANFFVDIAYATLDPRLRQLYRTGEARVN